MQCMMAILASFGITMEEFSFTHYENKPHDTYLKYLVNKLYPYGEVDQIEDPIPFQTNAIKKTKMIGQSITQFMKENDNSINCLINIANIIYWNRFHIKNNASINYLIEKTKLSEQEINKTVDFVKKITKKIENN